MTTIKLQIDTEANQLTVEVSEPTTGELMMQAFCTAILNLMNKCTADFNATTEDETERKRFKEFLYDEANANMSNVLESYAPELDAHPNLTEQAILEAENAILEKQFAEQAEQTEEVNANETKDQ